jgi:hypothetical protein
VVCNKSAISIDSILNTYQIRLRLEPILNFPQLFFADEVIVKVDF